MREELGGNRPAWRAQGTCGSLHPFWIRRLEGKLVWEPGAHRKGAEGDPALHPLKNRPPGEARRAERLTVASTALQWTVPSVPSPSLHLTPSASSNRKGRGRGGTLYQLSADALTKLGGSCFCPLGRPEPPQTCALNPDGEATGQRMPWTPWRAEHPARRLPRARPSATTLPLTSESPDPGSGTAPRLSPETETRHLVVLFKFPTQICEQIASPLFSALTLQIQRQVMKPHALGKGTPPSPQNMPGICAVQLVRFLRVRRKENGV